MVMFQRLAAGLVLAAAIGTTVIGCAKDAPPPLSGPSMTPVAGMETVTLKVAGMH